MFYDLLTNYEIEEAEDLYRVKVIAPGKEKEKFKVSTVGKTLTVKYENEIKYSFIIPDNTTDKVTAEYKDGILIVELEKRKANLIKVA